MNLSLKYYKRLIELTPETFPSVKAKASYSSRSFVSSSSVIFIFGHTPRNLSGISKQETKLKARSMGSRADSMKKEAPSSTWMNYTENRCKTLHNVSSFSRYRMKAWHKTREWNYNRKSDCQGWELRVRDRGRRRRRRKSNEEDVSLSFQNNLMLLWRRSFLLIPE